MKRWFFLILACLFLLTVIPVSADSVQQTEIETETVAKPGVYYKTRIRNNGWQIGVRNGVTSGLVGQGQRMQGFAVRLTSTTYGSVQYKSYIADKGWETTWKKNYEVSGSAKESIRVEGIKVRLTGELAKYYDILYRVYVPKFGWMGWSKNGDAAGTKGYNYRIEAIEIKIRAKTTKSSEKNSYLDYAKRKVIVIDPGHTGNRPRGYEPLGPGSSTMKLKCTTGTEGVATHLEEYQLNLQVSLKLRTELEKRGYKVIMTRTDNNACISNKERAEIANRANADAYIRVHANGDDYSSYTNGAMTICITSGNPYIRSMYAKCRKLSDCILNANVAATGCRRQYVWETDGMSGNNWSKVPTTIIEMGYMSNWTEDRRMASSDYQKKMVNGIANGIDAYFQ